MKEFPGAGAAFIQTIEIAKRERLSSFRLRFCALDFVQESVVLLKHCTVKAAIAPAQRIARILTYRGMEMPAPALLDEFDHIFDVHRNLLIAVGAAAAIVPGLSYKS
jgi:hypothetical protein